MGIVVLGLAVDLVAFQEFLRRQLLKVTFRVVRVLVRALVRHVDVKAAQIARREGLAPLGVEGGEALADLIVKGLGGIVGPAVVCHVDVALDGVLVGDQIVPVPAGAALHLDLRPALLLDGIAPVGHIDRAEAVNQLFLLIAGRGEDRLARGLAVFAFAALAVHLEGDDKAGVLDFAQPVKEDRRAAAVGAEGLGVGLVGGHQACAAARAGIDPGVIGFLTGRVLLHAVKLIGVIAAAAVRALHLLGRDVKEQVCSAARTGNHGHGLLSLCFLYFTELQRKKQEKSLQIH